MQLVRSQPIVLLASAALWLSACAAPAQQPANKPAASAPTGAPASGSSAAATSAPTGAGAAGSTIKLFSSFPMTGSALGQTQTMVNSIRMAIDEHGGRVGNFAIAYEALDDATPAKGNWDEGKEAENANRAVNDPDVMVYIGTYNSGAAKISIPITNRAYLFQISPANTSPGLTKPGKGEPGEPEIYYPTGVRNYARVVPADDIQGAVAARFAKEQLTVQRAYVLDDAEAYGRPLATVFYNEARRRGIQVSPANGPESIDRQATDYRSLALRIRQTNPDLVYFGGVTQNNAGKLWQDLRATLGPNVKLMGPDGIFEQAFLDAAGEAAIGTYVTFGGVPVSRYTGKAAEWLQRYRQRFNSEPEAYAIYAYEAANVALDAIQRAGRKERNAIREAGMNTKDYDGVLGRWSFDQNGDTTLTTMSVSQFKGPRMDQTEFIIQLSAE
ncbi:MAG TPA: branched-chain amino acid ABC transporter substrate-binding protein [Chloroflexota bacterium]|jgi:branched-chain amino acid transport system substrate-binding protein|nr:branched-chain amino acid ABC transporter substrate-binding protein [Chloroflexota bacterium]